MIEARRKKINKVFWKESLRRKELLELETKEDFAEVAHRKHIEHLGDISAITFMLPLPKKLTGSAGQQKMMRRPLLDVLSQSENVGEEPVLWVFESKVLQPGVFGSRLGSSWGVV